MNYEKIKNISTKLATVIMAIASLILLAVLLENTGITALKIISTNMASIGAPCGTVYIIAHNFIFKDLIRNKYLHLISFPAATFFSASILFIYSSTHRTEGVSFFATDIASTPLYSASAAGTVSIFLIGFLVSFAIRKKSTPSNA
ncbi:hypothetical protein D3C84_958050 [compost metagenome]